MNNDKVPKFFYHIDHDQLFSPGIFKTNIQKKFNDIS